MGVEQLLKDVVDKGASDLHLKAGQPPIYRVNGKLEKSRFPVLSKEDTKNIVYALMNEQQKNAFRRMLELDFTYEVPGVARFRTNAFSQKGHVGAALRVIPIRIKTIDEWGLPQILKEIAAYNRGLVLVTGPTGSGKTTTIAAMLEHMNTQFRRHVVTLEDPVEFVHQDNLCTIEQRGLGEDTYSFAEALKHVMRQNPDVVVVGEMRDLETMQMAIRASEMGALVLATLHTTDAAQTVDRILDSFPPDQHQQIRLQVSTVLQAVISQTLLKKLDESGRIAAFEILICTPGVRNVIREGKAYQIYSLIQTGQKYGMQMLDQSLKELYMRGIVAYGDALSKCSNPQEFERSASGA
ncbi:MAG: type IV pilus twitching motility protein PilT [bacterium]